MSREWREEGKNTVIIISKIDKKKVKRNKINYVNVVHKQFNLFMSIKNICVL